MHFLILAMLASFLAPSMVFACTNNLVPEVDVPTTVSSPDGGFAFTAEPGYPVAVKIDGEWVDGGISTPFEDDDGADPRGAYTQRSWSIWTPNEPLTNGEYQLTFDGATISNANESVMLVVAPSDGPAADFDSIEPVWVEDVGGVQTCCRNDETYCFQDCTDGRDFCTTCWWSQYIYKPSLEVQLTNIPGPYIGRVEVRHGEFRDWVNFHGSKTNSRLTISGSADNDAPVCAVAQLYDGEGTLLFESDESCIALADFPFKETRQIDNSELMAECRTTPEVVDDADMGENNLDVDDMGVETNSRDTDTGGCASVGATPSVSVLVLLLFGCMFLRRLTINASKAS